MATLDRRPTGRAIMTMGPVVADIAVEDAGTGHGDEALTEDVVEAVDAIPVPIRSISHLMTMDMKEDSMISQDRV